MQALATLPAGAWRDIAGVFTDVDDTLTEGGSVPAAVLQALAELAAADLTVIAVTGRPAGWSEPFALSWPVRAIVAENGAVLLRRTPAARPAPASVSDETGLGPAPALPDTLSKTYQTGAAERAAHWYRLQAVAARVLREVPGAALARDSAGRETDIAIDHSEFTQLAPAQIDAVLRILRSEGLNASVSSIHINAWFGQHDKWQGACWAARTLLGIDLAAQVGRWVYVGDSTNDQVMFQHFTHSVGVANIRRFEAALRHKPRYITEGERGAGFVEVARRLLADRA